MPVIRLATVADAAEIAAIYQPFVAGTAVSFEREAPEAAQIEGRMLEGRGYPWLVATEADSVVGYAYAGPHRKRAAYDWTVETSAYLAADARGRGLGKALMTHLLDALTAQGFGLALAGCTLPNDASVGLHQHLGFETVGVYPRVGFKLGQWHDVWWGAKLLPSCRAPRPWLPIQEVPT